MTDLFLTVLNAGAAASWLVLAVMLARVLLKKAPRGLLCSLWIIVGLRLVLPWFPSASFSLIPSAQIITPESMYDYAPEITSGFSSIDQAVNPVYSQSLAANEQASVNPLQVWTAVAANFWVLGTAAMALWALASVLRLKKRLAAAVPDGDGIYVCDGIDTPFLLGLFRPRIYLPEGLDEATRAHVIAHERAHIQRRDHFWKALAYGLLTVFWFHPLLWLAYILLCRDIELACDERVIHAMTAPQKKAYSTALLECSIHRRTIAACPLAFGEVGVKARVRSVLRYKKPGLWLAAGCVLASAVIALCFLTDPLALTPEIRYQGVLYVQEGPNRESLPEDSAPVGMLRSVLHSTDAHPDENFQAANLDESAAGCALHLAGDTLYLEKTGGGYVPFRLQTPNGLLTDLIKDATDIQVSVYSYGRLETEDLTGDRLLAMELAIESLRHGTEPAGSPLMTVVMDRQGKESSGIRLYRYGDGAWAMTVTEEAYGVSHWRIPESGLLDQLETELVRYFGRVSSWAYATDPDSDGTLTADPVSVNYETVTHAEYSLTLGIPEGWLWEEIPRGTDDEYLALRFRPKAADTGWVNLYYHPGEDAVIHLPYSDRTEQIAFPGGTYGTASWAGTGEAWMYLQLATEMGILLASTEEVDSWWGEFGDSVNAVLGSVILYRQGRNLMTGGYQLGIHLNVENVTSTGLTLICRQDGTLAEQLHTGAYFAIERLENGAWTAVDASDEIAWTTEAWVIEQNGSYAWPVSFSSVYGELPPGTYRIGKHFSGKLPELGTVTAALDWTEQTYYTEFIIE